MYILEYNVIEDTQDMHEYGLSSRQSCRDEECICVSVATAETQWSRSFHLQRAKGHVCIADRPVLTLELRVDVETHAESPLILILWEERDQDEDASRSL